MTQQEPRIFLCHANEDKERVIELYHQLKKAGYNPWLDKYDLLPGQNWRVEIRKMLSDRNNLVVVCLSNSSVSKRGTVQREIKWALDLLEEMPEGAIYLIPARLEKCQVPEQLKDLHWVDLFEPDGFEYLTRSLDFEIANRKPPAEPEKVNASDVEISKQQAPRPAQATPAPAPEVVSPPVVEHREPIKPKLIQISADDFLMGSDPKKDKYADNNGQPQPIGSRLRSLPHLALAGLLVLVLLVGVAAVWLSGLGGDLFRTPTATVPVGVAPPITETLVATATPQPPPPTPTGHLALHDTWTRSTDATEMVYVPGGTFEMGSTEGADDNEPLHTVTLDSFWIDRTEVTNAQYAGCVAAGVCSPPSQSSSATHDSYYGDSEYDDYPVIWVSWNDAATYCGWAGGRLPSEAEWEYAARGPEGRVYPWGNDPPDDTLLNYNRNVGDTEPVGSYAKGKSWVGALDMAGNVREWVNDWYNSDYAWWPAENPIGPDAGDVKALRGGSWDYNPGNMRSAYRDGSTPEYRNERIGFRCVVASTSSP